MIGQVVIDVRQERVDVRINRSMDPSVPDFDPPTLARVVRLAADFFPGLRVRVVVVDRIVFDADGAVIAALATGGAR